MKYWSFSKIGIMLATLLVGTLALSQTRQIRRNEDSPQKRVALVVGNGAYLHLSPLRNPVNDARAIARVLRETGFEVNVLQDGTAEAMNTAVNDFITKLRAGDVALFYYAGHGMQIAGENFLVPVDLNAANEVQARYRSLRAIEILEQMEASGAKLQMLVLDACRDNPFGSGRSIGNKGLAPMNAGRGSFVAYATGPGRTADDNRQGQNGLYTSYLMEALKEPDLKLEEVFKRAGARVQQASNGKQIPWTASSVQGDFYFRPPQTETVPPTSPVSQTVTPDLQFQAEIAFWNAVDKDSTEALKLYLAKYPIGQFAELARLNLGRIQKRSPAGAGSSQSQQQMASASIPSLPPGAPPPTGELKSVIQGVKFEFVQIQSGTFTMGSDQGDADEKPPHQVTVSRGFQMGKYEVTQGQWQAVMGSKPSKFTNCGLDCPVENISWLDVEQFLGRLNGQGDGYVYRLPTEAEWEYAARTGTTGDYGGSGNVDEMGWYDGNSGGQTHPVGRKKPNGWGLYDMHGNVWEWVADWYDENYYRNSPTTDPQGPNGGTTRVLRGGSWDSVARNLRSANRHRGSPDNRLTYNGFRLVRLAARTSP